jgi:hypothetical protein
MFDGEISIIVQLFKPTKGNEIITEEGDKELVI